MEPRRCLKPSFERLPSGGLSTTRTESTLHNRIRNAKWASVRQARTDGARECTTPNRRGGLMLGVPLVVGLVGKLKSRGLSDQEIRRLFESALMRQEEPARTK
jgi:hypothetical protein